MNASHAFSLRLIAIAAAAVLGLASPAFASQDQNHPESHDGNGSDSENHTGQGHDGNGSHPENHTGQGQDSNGNHPENHTGQGQDSNGNHPENHGNGSDSSGGSANQSRLTLSTALAGAVQPGARGVAKLNIKPRGTKFEAELKIPVPSTALGVADKTAARDATLVLTLSRAGVPYAECDFDWKATRQNQAGTVAAKYKIEIYSRGGVTQERAGLCDIDLATPGAQAGVPAIQAGDSAAVTIDTNGAVFLEGAF